MSPTASTAGNTGDRRWLALGLIAAAQFMVIMDTSIIGVALPEMQQDLGFDPQNLSRLVIYSDDVRLFVSIVIKVHKSVLLQ